LYRTLGRANQTKCPAIGVPPYEAPDVLAWRDRTLTGRKWFDEHGVSFQRHYTGSLACVPSRPTIFTGHYPDLHGVT
jgi:arylsulfatase A-like enzyme